MELVSFVTTSAALGERQESFPRRRAPRARIRAIRSLGNHTNANPKCIVPSRSCPRPRSSSPLINAPVWWQGIMEYMPRLSDNHVKCYLNQLLQGPGGALPVFACACVSTSKPIPAPFLVFALALSLTSPSIVSGSFYALALRYQPRHQAGQHPHHLQKFVCAQINVVSTPQ